MWVDCTLQCTYIAVRELLGGSFSRQRKVDPTCIDCSNLVITAPHVDSLSVSPLSSQSKPKLHYFQLCTKYYTIIHKTAANFLTSVLYVWTTLPIKNIFDLFSSQFVECSLVWAVVVWVECLVCIKFHIIELFVWFVHH